MKFLAFLAVVLLSGAISGTAQGMANFVLVEPVLDKAIYLENKALFDSGNEQDSVEFRIAHEEYRTWQKGGQLVSSAILGMSMGSLFGLVFGYARKSLPSSNILKKTLILAVIMWLILFIIPFVKYPSNPPTVGDPRIALDTSWPPFCHVRYSSCAIRNSTLSCSFPESNSALFSR